MSSDRRAHARAARAAVCLFLSVVSTSSAAQTRPSEVLRRVQESGARGRMSMPQGSNLLVAAADANRTLAPYFQVEGEEGAERLPLKSTSAEIDVAGVIARIQVKQRFENAGKTPIEAVYVFPASTRAAVHGMRMRTGGRTIEARIDTREAARQAYTSAKQSGQRASLLEQQRPNVFTMSVANVMPGEAVDVELEYSELLVPEGGIYELVYPTVVGPRYGGGADAKKDGWIANPYLQEGQKEPYAFDVKVRLESGLPVRELASPSHPVEVTYENPQRAQVALRPGAVGGNRDFVLRYRLSGDAIQTGMLLGPGEKEGFFALMVEPPARLDEKEIPPREYIFLLDVSGSMHGFPLETAKVLMKRLLGQLRPTDTFNLALFSGASHVMRPQGSVPATPENLQAALQLVSQQRGGGGTELLEGLRASYAIPRAERNVARSVVVVTDGYVGVEADAYRFIRERLDEANLFSFGIGSSVNRALIEGMARAGQGEPFVVLKPADAQAEADKLQRYIQRPALSNVQFRFEGFDAYEIAPARLPSLMAERPLLVYGKYRGKPQGRIHLTGETGRGTYRQTIEVGAQLQSAHAAALRWLWARKWVQLLEDEHQLRGSDEIEKAITQLGLEYVLLTPFTSFVAVDSQVVNKGGASVQVQQPLPLPEGVSNQAIGQLAPMKAMRGWGGYGGARPRAAAPDARAAPAPPPSGGTPEPSMDSFSEVAEDEGRSPKTLSRPRQEPRTAMEDRTPTSPTVSIAPSAGVRLSTSAAKLLTELQREVAWFLARAGPCSTTHARLRLSLDAKGQVTAVELLEGDEQGACIQALRRHLLGRSHVELRGAMLELKLDP